MISFLGHAIWDNQVDHLHVEPLTSLEVMNTMGYTSVIFSHNNHVASAANATFSGYTADGDATHSSDTITRCDTQIGGPKTRKPSTSSGGMSVMVLTIAMSSNISHPANAANVITSGYAAGGNAFLPPGTRSSNALKLTQTARRSMKCWR